MGRITIFSLPECPHCNRTKAALAARCIPYTEISLSDYPDKRTDMLVLADRLSVPQVFFNDKHIGGADDTLALLEKWDVEEKYSSPLERYEQDIAAIEGAPSDERLQVPTNPPFKPKPEPPRTEEDLVTLYDGSKATRLEITQMLVAGMPKSDKNYILKRYFNVFTRQEGCDALMKLFNIGTVNEAIIFGKMLQNKQLFDHVTKEHTFSESGSFFFRLQAFQEPSMLNTYRIWTDRVDPDSMSLLARLKKMIGKIESACTNDEGFLDYVACTEHPTYSIFEEAVCELQGVSLIDMTNDEKLAFGINLYNLMIKHAFIKIGIPSGAIARSSFFSTVGYVIGGDRLSFQDLENGVLRANKKAPGLLSSAPFSSSDSRLALALPEVDPRIHFALNCGAKSCPPVKKFTSDAIKEELRIVSQAFCEQDDNVGIDEKKNEISLTKLMSWYGSDFAPSASDLPKKVITYLRGEKKKKLEGMINSGKVIKVKFNEYDWGTNASKSMEFKRDKIVVDKVGLF
eukprot:CAMPEP_0194280572 /NCGR_PEP_ID=MMETSP0169-20130528/17967_1 /TAXON_ID=218684 /ORGANISM="Corethron pennatum, Strain L29A3" /LENGTH=513 /DNA_ID=CAMNT_0039025345 /DNA_START=96 /DNA_END=1637 /DNA_ORIENTATION=-